jgi:hypothetical protein
VREPSVSAVATPADRAVPRPVAAGSYGVPRWLAIGVTAVSAVVFYVMSTHGSLNPLYENSGAPFSSVFFFAQAQGLIHGHLNVRPDQLSGECFVYHAQCLGYFGLTPSLLRVPLLPLLDAINHSLTPVYMTAALTLAVGSTMAILSHVLSTVRRTPLLTFLVGAVALTLGPASVLEMISRPAVYEEAIAWSVAFALFGVYCFLRWWSGPRTLWACLLVLSLVLSTNSRPTTLPLGVVLGAGIFIRLLRERWEPARERRALVFAWTVALLPIATCLGVYWIKFHMAIPNILLNQQMSGPGAAPWWLAIRRVDHNSLQGLRFIPTGVYNYLRPDAIAFGSGFPFVDFRFGPTAPPGLIGIPTGGVYLEPFTSLPDAMPLAILLILVGIGYGIVRARRRGVGLRTGLVNLLHSPMTYCIAGTLASAAVALTGSFLTNRYLGDMFPAVALCLIAATRVLAEPAAALSGRRAILVGVGASVLVLWALLVNLGLEYRLWWHSVP